MAAPDLDAFLAAHPNIAQAIRFEFASSDYKECESPIDSLGLGMPRVQVQSNVPPVAQIPQTPPWFQRLSPQMDLGFYRRFPYLLTYPLHNWAQMPEKCKKNIRNSYVIYWNWLQTAGPLYQQYLASGFATKPAGFDETFRTDVDPDPQPLAYPPTNLQYVADPPAENSRRTVIPSSDAFKLFARNVAFRLALENSNVLSWNLQNEGSESLKEIFDGTLLFQYAPQGNLRPDFYGKILHAGHAVESSNLPGPPLITFSFLAKLGAIRPTRLETIHRLLEWERYYLQHTTSGDVNDECPKTLHEVLYGYPGYNGEAPLPAIINGHVMECPLWSNGNPTTYSGVMHWIGGCSGATGFNNLVAASVNIGAPQVVKAHFQSGFFIEGGKQVWQCHGDDPYNIRGDAEIPITATLIDDATFHQYFLDEDPNLSDEQNEAIDEHNDKHVSRCTADLRIQYLPVRMLATYGTNGDAAKPHHQQEVYSHYFETTYTVAELEAKNFWPNLEAKVQSLGGCENISYPPIEIPPMP
jgi:hypothetical protein